MRTPSRRAARLVKVAGSGLLASVLVVVALAVTGTRLMAVSSDSMRPTYGRGDHLVVVRTDGEDVRRGDVVVVATPAAWREAAARRDGVDVDTVPTSVVKRVIGVGGDEVACCRADGTLTVDGDPLDEPYLARPAGATVNTAFRVTVPPGALWLMGDNRDDSFDSRAMHARGGGFVARDLVRSRVLLHW